MADPNNPLVRRVPTAPAGMSQRVLDVLAVSVLKAAVIFTMTGSEEDLLVLYDVSVDYAEALSIE